MTLYRFLFAPVLLAVAVLAGPKEPARTEPRRTVVEAPPPPAATAPARQQAARPAGEPRRGRTTLRASP